MTTPQELKAIVSEGLLSFPVTDFDAQGNFNAKTYAQRLEWLAPYGATALFAAGGTGELDVYKRQEPRHQHRDQDVQRRGEQARAHPRPGADMGLGRRQPFAGDMRSACLLYTSAIAPRSSTRAFTWATP